MTEAMRKLKLWHFCQHGSADTADLISFINAPMNENGPLRTSRYESPYLFSRMQQQDEPGPEAGGKTRNPNFAAS
jgi:hypothetical protein